MEGVRRNVKEKTGGDRQEETKGEEGREVWEET